MEPVEIEQPTPPPPEGGGDPAVAPSQSHTPSHGGPPRRQVSNITLPKKKSGITGACSNLVNSIVGAGIIGIPFAFSQSGLIAGIILLLLVSYFTDKTLRMLIELASFSPRLKGHGVLTFEDMLSLPYGRFGTIFVLTSMFITAYGAMVAYLLIIKDTLPVVFGLEDEVGTGSFVEREVLMLVTSLVIVVPLSMQRDFSSLAKTSILSVIADILLVIFIAVFSPVKSSVENAGGIGEVIKKNAVNGGGFFVGFGVLTIAMTCQHSAFIVAGSLDNLTSKRWATVTCISLTISAILCLILGVFGYLGFLGDTQGDILNNFNDSPKANVARVLLAITMFFTYPMEAFVARHVLVQLIWGGDMDGKVTTTLSTGESTTTKAKMFGCLNRRHQVTIGIYIMTLIPALIVDDLGPVLSITGAIGGCCLAYIGPGLAYLGVHGDSFLAWITDIVYNKNSKTQSGKASNAVHEGDLPVEGDATANLPDMNGSRPTSLSTAGPKPWWWWPTFMPIWVAIASTGARGMNERLMDLEQSHGGPHTMNSTNQAENGDATEETEVIGARKRDYFFSMFFILFGIVALVAGIISNIYVQVNDIFYTPTR